MVKSLILRSVYLQWLLARLFRACASGRCATGRR
jgi:hypothetical protein